MAKKTQEKKYSPTQHQLAMSKFCHDIGIAIVVKPVTGQYNLFWVEIYIIGDKNSSKFLRIDLTKEDSVSNRQVFNEYDALDKCFEMYELLYKSRVNDDKKPP